MAANEPASTTPDPETQATPAGKVDELEEEIDDTDATVDPDDTETGLRQESAQEE